jgi:hypothetical protein
MTKNDRGTVNTVSTASLIAVRIAPRPDQSYRRKFPSYRDVDDEGQPRSLQPKNRPGCQSRLPVAEQQYSQRQSEKETPSKRSPLGARHSFGSNPKILSHPVAAPFHSHPKVGPDADSSFRSFSTNQIHRSLAPIFQSFRRDMETISAPLRSAI